MYTVVLMAALTAGTSTPDFHPRGGCGGHHGSVAVGGCSGYYGCFGCYGANAAGYGGTCIGTYGGYSVSGPHACYGCWGGWSSNTSLNVYSGPGSYGYGYGYNGGGTVGYGPNYGISFQCHGCYGCYGGWSCYGSPTTPSGYQLFDGVAPPAGVAPAPSGPGVAPQVPEAPLPKAQGRIRSKVIIEVPENAKLYVDDILMKDGPTVRNFQTPPLSPEQTYFYEVRVEVTINGKTTSDTQRVVIRPGETVTAAFNDPGRPPVVTVRNAPPQE